LIEIDRNSVHNLLLYSRSKSKIAIVSSTIFNRRYLLRKRDFKTHRLLFYITHAHNCAQINFTVHKAPYISDTLLAFELLSISAFVLNSLTRFSGSQSDVTDGLHKWNSEPATLAIHKTQE
jgi:hypothetical protein